MHISEQLRHQIDALVESIRGEPTEADITRIAQTVMLDDYKDAVRVAAGRVAVDRARQVAVLTAQYYMVLAPLPKQPRILSIKPHGEVHEAPSRQEHKVHVKNFTAFCKAMGLSEREMQRVVDGEQKEHRGWESSPRQHDQHLQVSKRYKEPRVEDVETTDRKPVKRIIVQQAHVEPPIEFVPSDK